MLTATRCIAASLALHAGLVGLASSNSVENVPHGGAALLPLEGAIDVDATSGGSDTARSGPGSHSEQATAEAAAPAAEPVAVPRKVSLPARAPRPRSPLPSVPAATHALQEPAPAASLAAPAGLPPAPGTTSGSGAEVPAQPSGSPASGPASGTGGPAASSLGSSPGGGTGAGAAASASGTGGGSSGAARGQLLARYLKGVRDRVAHHREYPYLARRANLEGTICLRVSIGASGEVRGVTPTCGGANLPLLRAALKSVAEAAPFAPLPSALGRELTLDVPIVFDLDNM